MTDDPQTLTVEAIADEMDAGEDVVRTAFEELREEGAVEKVGDDEYRSTSMGALLRSYAKAQRDRLFGTGDS